MSEPSWHLLGLSCGLSAQMPWIWHSRSVCAGQHLADQMNLTSGANCWRIPLSIRRSKPPFLNPSVQMAPSPPGPLFMMDDFCTSGATLPAEQECRMPGFIRAQELSILQNFCAQMHVKLQGRCSRHTYPVQGSLILFYTLCRELWQIMRWHGVVRGRS